MGGRFLHGGGWNQRRPFITFSHSLVCVLPAELEARSCRCCCRRSGRCRCHHVINVALSFALVLCVGLCCGCCCLGHPPRPPCVLVLALSAACRSVWTALAPCVLCSFPLMLLRTTCCYQVLLSACRYRQVISVAERRFCFVLYLSGTLPEAFLYAYSFAVTHGREIKYSIPLDDPDLFFPLLLFSQHLSRASALGEKRKEIHSGSVRPWRKMFSRAHLPLMGGDFRARFDVLSTQARTNYERLEVFSQLMAPLKWEDQLSSSQQLRFHCVAAPAEWDNIAPTFRLALQKVPVLAFSAHTVDEDLRYVSIGVYDVHVAVFSLGALKQQGTWLKLFDLLPAEVRKWLADPSVVVLVAEESVVPEEPTGCVLNNCVFSDRIYMLYQSKRVVNPVVPTADGALAKQMSYCFQYTHQPCTPEYFRHLVGDHQYRRWPDHRQPGWRPKSAFDLKVREEFFLFFETMGALAFVYRLLQHGVIYEDLAAVAPTLPFGQMVMVFLQGGSRAHPANTKDPLGLFSDAREENDTVMLTDQGLVEEFSSEQEKEDPSAHPGYFTKEGALQAAAEAAPVGAGKDADAGGVVAGAGSGPERADAGGVVAGEGSGTEDREEDGDARLPPRRRRRGRTDGRRVRHSPSRSRSPPRKRHASWPQVPEPPGPRPWNDQVTVPQSTPAPWSVDLRSQLSLPSNNNNQEVLARMSAAVVAAQSFPALPNVSASFAYDSAQDLRARLDVRRGVAALAGEAQEEGLAPDLPLDYNSCFAQRTLRAARRGDAAASRGEFVCPGEEGDEDAGFPAIERDPANLFLTAAERAFNPFVERPSFHGRCGFCSGNHCSRRNRAGTGSNCRKMRQHLKFTPTRRICLYRRCKTPIDHHTAVCGELHRRCAVCGCRGHGPEDACDNTSPVIMSRLRVDFEEYAGLGIYTRQRFTRLEWGFYPTPTTVPPQPVVSYVRLTNLPVLEAIALVTDLTCLPQNQVAAVPEAFPPVDAPLGKSRISRGMPGGDVEMGGGGAADGGDCAAEEDKELADPAARG